MQPLRILIGGDTFAPDINGAARFTERLAAGLVDRGHEVVVAAPAGERIQPAWLGDAVETIEGRPMRVLRWRSLRWPFHETWRFVWPWHARRLARRTLDLVRPDVIHVQSHFVVGRGLIREARRRGIRTIGTNHAMPENLLDHTGMPEFVNRLALKWAWRDVETLFGSVARVTTPTRRAAEFLERNTRLRDVVVVSNGIDASHYRPDFSPRDEIRLLFVGRQDTEKKIDVVVRAFARLDPALGAHLDLAGHGDQEPVLRRLAEELGVADRVHQYGAVSDEELVRLYSRATMFVIASTAELQSIATLEALSSGLPVVAADAMALPHLVQDGVNGWLFPPGDVEAAADRIRRVLALSPQERRAMQERAIETTRVHSLAHTLDVFEALYAGEEVPAG